MNRRYKIKKGIKKAGRLVHLGREDWVGMPYYAVIQHNYKKTKSNFEKKLTEIGYVEKDYYTYIGPFDHDITAIGDDTIVYADQEMYLFKKKEAVRADGEILYYFGILKKVQGGSYA